MKNKNSLILILIVFVSIFAPKNIYALEEFNSINVDYRFTIENDDGQQHFILKDDYGIINLESKYDNGERYYYFEKYSVNDTLKSYYERYFSNLSYYLDNRFWIDYGNAISFYYFPDEAGYAKGCGVNYGNTHCTTYTTIPLLLENKETHQRKIVFGIYHISYIDDNGVLGNLYNHSIYSNFSMGNTDSVYTFPSAESNVYYSYNDSYGEYFLDFDSIIFMKKAVFNYSDELWEELNNEPIASSEMRLEDSSVVMGVNELNDLTKPSVIQFSNKSDTNQGNSLKEETIVDAITNPKTWNNGIVILVISMIVVIGSSFVLIKRKSN